MTKSKTKKKVALIKATVHALELAPSLKGVSELESIKELMQEATLHMDGEQIDEARKNCSKSIFLIKEVIQKLGPAKLRKALDRQITKIDKY